MIGFALYCVIYPEPFWETIILALLCVEALLILSYLNHLRKASGISLKRIVSGKDRMVSIAFLVSVFLLPGLLALAPLFTKNLELFAAILALSSGTGVVLERILFFRLEHPDFLLTRSQNP
jgi:hypothetical protein